MAELVWDLSIGFDDYGPITVKGRLERGHDYYRLYLDFGIFTVKRRVNEGYRDFLLRMFDDKKDFFSYFMGIYHSYHLFKPRNSKKTPDPIQTVRDPCQEDPPIF